MKDFEDWARASLSLSLSQNKLFPAAYPKSDYAKPAANGWTVEKIQVNLI